MSEWKEESIRRRDVRSGIGLEEERSNLNKCNSKTKGARDWVVVYCTAENYKKVNGSRVELLEHEINYRLDIWGDYKNEDDAKKIVDSAERSGFTNRFRQFYCHRETFELMYKALTRCSSM